MLWRQTSAGKGARKGKGPKSTQLHRAQEILVWHWTALLHVLRTRETNGILFVWIKWTSNMMILVWGRIKNKKKHSCSLGHKPGWNSKMTDRPLTHKPGSKVKINALWLNSCKEHDILTLYFSRWILNKLKLAYFNGIASVWVSLPICCTIPHPAWEG